MAGYDRRIYADQVGWDERDREREREPRRARDDDRIERNDRFRQPGGEELSQTDRGGFFGSGSNESREPRGRRSGRDEGEFGHDDDNEGLPIDETGRLIGSNKVEGTPVYGRRGERLGTIYNFMVDKRTGQVEYAVMAYGGFLRMGQRYYPLPWRMLSFDTREGGYRIDMSDRDLETAPSFGREDEPRFNRDYGRRVHNYYGLKH